MHEIVTNESRGDPERGPKWVPKGSKRGSRRGTKGSKKGPKGSEKGPKKTPFLTFLEPFYSKNLSYEVVFVAFAA